MRYLILILTFLCSLGYSYSQDNSSSDSVLVYGTVFDKKSNETVPFANVYIDRSLGTVTDFYGYFNMKIPKYFIDGEYELRVSYVGFQGKSILIDSCFQSDLVCLTIGLDKEDQISTDCLIWIPTIPVHRSPLSIQPIISTQPIIIYKDPVVW